MKMCYLLLALCLGVFTCGAQDYDPTREADVLPVWHESPAQARLPVGETDREWRGLWVDAWNKGVFSAAQVDAVVQTASRHNFNAIVLQVRRRGDAIYFPALPNAEPRMAGLPADFDALREMIACAHAAGIEVHAWITTFLISTATPPASQEHVFYRHPEYLTRNYAGEKNIGEGYYLDPGHPQALAWNERVVMDLLLHYDIDGIHFDYVRYPQGNAGYNPEALRRYNREFGLSGKPSWDDERFSGWRRRQITDWLRNMYAKIAEIKPRVKVTAATFAYRADAYRNRFQDWPRWMSENILDANLPMNYSRSFETFRARTDDVLVHTYGRQVYMGIGSYLLGADDVIAQALYARQQRARGILFFSYAHISNDGNWLQTYEAIRHRLFPSPAQIPDMPWKTSPDVGYVHGQVVAAHDGQPVYNARLLIPTLRKFVKTDATGHFAFLGLPPGRHDLRCQCPGYEMTEKTVHVQGGQVVSVDVRLKVGELSRLVLDTEDATFTGKWTIGVTASEKHGADYRFAGPGTGAGRAVFPIPPEFRGRCRVYTCYSTGNNRTSAARYEVCHASGTSTITVDQRQNGARWNLLGTWEFGPQPAWVALSDDFQDGQVVIADAILLEKK